MNDRYFLRNKLVKRWAFTSAERLRALEILSSLAHSKTLSEYETHLDELKHTNITSVIEYVMVSWHASYKGAMGCLLQKQAFEFRRNYHQQTGIHVQQVQKYLIEICEFVAVLL